tara:strand:+ start:24859 stop:25062 length:204 start_codon:yes stop_codon:yes gene_type:complete
LRSQLSDKWGWYNALYVMADEKVEKIDVITKLKVEECLTFMCYKQDISRIQKQEHEQEMMKYNRYGR